MFRIQHYQSIKNFIWDKISWTIRSY